MTDCICDWCEKEYKDNPNKLLFYCSRGCLSSIDSAGGMAPLELKRAKKKIEALQDEIKELSEELTARRDEDWPWRS